MHQLVQLFHELVSLDFSMQNELKFEKSSLMLVI